MKARVLSRYTRRYLLSAISNAKIIIRIKMGHNSQYRLPQRMGVVFKILMDAVWKWNRRGKEQHLSTVARKNRA